MGVCVFLRFLQSCEKNSLYSTVQSHVIDGNQLHTASLYQLPIRQCWKKVPSVVSSTIAPVMCYLSALLQLSFFVAVCS